MIIQKNVSLKEYSNYKIGGIAAYFLDVSSTEELIEGLRQWQEMKLTDVSKPFLLAAGTKVLIADTGYDGLVIHNNILGIKKDGEEIVSSSGVKVFDLLKFCEKESLSGFEWAGGLPGTIGGAVRGNAGAFKGETKDVVSRVKSVNINTLEIKIRLNQECNFGYRNSYFKTEEGRDEIITEVFLKLIQGNREEIIKKIEELEDFRKNNHPLEYPSLGSTFKNIPFDLLQENLKNQFGDVIKNDPFQILPVVKLLTLADLKGIRVGDAQISEKQPNFIVNLGNAKASDVKALIVLAKEKVFQKFGIRIEEEIMYLGF
jgi:UDP-N-acetylmuramate dehydrogenase